MRYLSALAILAALTFPFIMLAQPIPQSLHDPDFSDYYLDSARQRTIEGVIINLPEDVSREGLVGYSAVSLLSKLQREVTVDVATDGSFIMKIPENYHTQEVWFWVGDQDKSLYFGTLLVREGLSLSIDYAALKSQGKVQWASGTGVNFSGPDGELTRARNVLTTAEIAKGYNNAAFPIIMDQKASPTEKRNQLDSLYTVIGDHRQEVLQEFSAAVRDFLHRDLISNQLGLLATTFWKEDLSPEFLKRYQAHTPPVISNSGKDYYRYFASAVNGNALRAAKSLKDEPIPPLTDQLVALNKMLANFTPDRADLVYLYQEDTDPTADLQRLENALAHIKTPWIANLLKERRDLAKAETERLLSVLNKIVPNATPADLGTAEGSLPFGADLYTVADDISGEALLAKLRGSFPGKALYLDMWAVWCQPCLGEMPHSASLKTAAKELPVEFVYLCTDSGGSPEKWQNIIAQHEIGGTHLYVPNKVHQELMQLFAAKGYPTYVLLQADGTPKLDVQRPSQLDREKLRAALE